MVSTPVKNISQIGNLPQLGVKTKKINHHLDYTVLFGRLQVLALPSNAGNPAKIRILFLLWPQFLPLAGAAPLGEGPPPGEPGGTCFKHRTSHGRESHPKTKALSFNTFRPILNLHVTTGMTPIYSTSVMPSQYFGFKARHCSN